MDRLARLWLRRTLRAAAVRLVDAIQLDPDTDGMQLLDELEAAQGAIAAAVERLQKAGVP